MEAGLSSSSFLEQLAIERNFVSRRASSWDRSGRNIDYVQVEAQARCQLASIEGPGCIKHIYATAISLDPFYYRNVVLRMYWDGESRPSVEVPLGDFFGIGHCRPRLFSSLLLSVNPGNPINPHEYYTYGINCYFPMPFSKSARIEIENQSEIKLEAFWYHIDYQTFDSLAENAFRFHACWNRQLTKAAAGIQEKRNISLWDGVNLKAQGNYPILDTRGNGQLVGIMLNVDNIAGNWWGEGDDMVFIDDEGWPPSLHGTGTEEIFGGGACPANEYHTPYCGFQLISHGNWYRHNSMYRFFIADPIRFRKSIRYTIEHGHANNFENDYSSVAYWYQAEPHQEFRLLPAGERSPLLPTAGERELIEQQTRTVQAVYRQMSSVLAELSADQAAQFLRGCCAAEAAYQKGDFPAARNEWEQIQRTLRR
jgi:hypothetical protein